MKEIEILIENWEKKHSGLLMDYQVIPLKNETTKLYARSEMKNVLDFIRDLKFLNSIMEK